LLFAAPAVLLLAGEGGGANTRIFKYKASIKIKERFLFSFLAEFFSFFF